MKIMAAPIDPNAGGYLLPKTIGVMQTAFEPEPIQDRVTAHMTCYELLQEVLAAGFGSLKLWMSAVPFDGMGPWTWHTPWGAEMGGDYNIQGLDMERFWKALPDGFVLFLRPQAPVWTWFENNPGIPDAGAGPQIALADHYAIATRLYELIGDHRVQIVFTDWETDWFSFHEDNGGQGYMIGALEQRQRDIERARAETFQKLGHKPNLEIYHGMVVNKYPNNAPDWKWRYNVEMIRTMDHPPDFIGLSYWLKGKDPRETLDWIVEQTGYEPNRIYIDEIGANESQQVQRFHDYIPMIWDWGVRTQNIWMWKQTWSAVPIKANKGLWKQKQPCVGKVEFTEPTDGYYELQRLMGGA